MGESIPGLAHAIPEWEPVFRTRIDRIGDCVVEMGRRARALFRSGYRRLIDARRIAGNRAYETGDWPLEAVQCYRGRPFVEGRRNERGNAEWSCCIMGCRDGHHRMVLSPMF